MKTLFVRIPLSTYEGLVRHCMEQTLQTGARVSMRAVVSKALGAFLVEQAPTSGKQRREPARARVTSTSMTRVR